MRSRMLRLAAKIRRACKKILTRDAKISPPRCLNAQFLAPQPPQSTLLFNSHRATQYFVIILCTRCVCLDDKTQTSFEPWQSIRKFIFGTEDVSLKFQTSQGKVVQTFDVRGRFYDVHACLQFCFREISANSVPFEVFSVTKLLVFHSSKKE